ncbi:hypothetical protein [Paenibacillus methanolicus]|uniref:hypothetical protein n=1 Tax=Paenibacillus methanolicus TaxID=582686 RepID=UPI0011E74C2A|nr:hypothetical protein [Paenibacillus methanolicus]
MSDAFREERFYRLGQEGRGDTAKSVFREGRIAMMFGNEQLYGQIREASSPTVISAAYGARMG